uniref:GB1/RHD3-type G domain-containing protein n=1 Tax=Arcella intermedia TaxID=1963864 RepID=A0A6B2KX61_9EUKA
MLEKLQTPFAVVAVAGPYRSGKSYLLNRLLNRQNGFKIGQTVNPETKGIYMWSEPVMMVNPETRQKIPTILIDTEGVSSIQQNKTYDAKLFSLALLLCDYLVYNTTGVIDDQAISMLSLIAELSKFLVSKSSGAQQEEFFPAFGWVLRDFVLELVDESGHEITPNQYLENCLKERNTPGQEQNNQTRRALRSYFSTRDCFCLVRPVADEKDLKRVDALPESHLRKEFTTGVNNLIRKIHSNLREKRFFGKPLTGPAFVSLIAKYIERINHGTIPTILDTWSSVAESENIKISERVKSLASAALEQKIANGPLEAEELSLHYRNELANVKKILSEQLLGEDTQKFCLSVENRIAEVYDRLSMKNRDLSVNSVKDLYNNLCIKYIVEPLKNQKFRMAVELASAWKTLCSEYLKQAKGSAKYEFFASNAAQHVADSFHEFFTSLNEQFRAKESELKDSMSKQKALLEELNTQKHNLQIDNMRSSSELSLMKEKLRQSEDSNRNLKERYDELQKEYEEVQRNTDQVSNEMEKVNSNYSNLLSLNSNLRKEIENYVTNEKKLSAQLESISNQYKELQKKIGSSESFTSELQSKVNAMTNEIERKNELLESLSKNLEKTQSEAKSMNKQLEDKFTLVQANQELTERIRLLESNQDMNNSKTFELNEQIKKLSSATEDLNDTLAERLMELKNTQEQLEFLHAQNLLLKGEAENSTKLISDNQQLHRQMDLKEERIKNLEGFLQQKDEKCNQLLLTNTSIDAEMRKYRENYNKLSIENLKIKNEISGLNMIIQEKDKQLESAYANNNPTDNNEIIKLQTQLEAKVAEMETQAAGYQSEIKALKKKNKSLQEEFSEFKAESAQKKVESRKRKKEEDDEDTNPKKKKALTKADYKKALTAAGLHNKLPTYDAPLSEYKDLYEKYITKNTNKK